MKQNNQKITLTGENGVSIDFNIAAFIEYGGYQYAVLKPLDNKLGLDQDEAVVFRIENGNSFELEYDDEVIDAVANIYNNDIE